MYRVLTIAREYATGGSAVARDLAARLGWRLLDKALIAEVARAGRVDPQVAERLDERLDPWLHRVSRRALWHGGFDSVSSFGEADVFDAERVAALAREFIEAAHVEGGCVIVGRGGQCVLAHRPDVFHAFLYAPLAHRAARLRERQGGESAAAEERIRERDRQRQEFVRAHFGCDWRNPHLYHLLVNTVLGEATAAELILQALKRGG